MKRIIPVLALSALMLSFGAPAAEATPLTLTIDSTDALGALTQVSVVDNEAGDLNGNVGELVFFGMVGIFDFNVTFAMSSQEGELAKLLMDSTSTHNTGEAGALRVTLRSDYTNTSIGQALASGVASGSLVAAAGSDITVQSWVNTTQVYDGIPTSNTSGPTGPVDPFTGLGGFSFADTAAVDLAFSDFTLMTQIIVNFAAQLPGGGENSVSMTMADVAVEGVPEPATLFLLGSGLLGLVTAGRNHARKRSAR